MALVEVVEGPAVAALGPEVVVAGVPARKQPPSAGAWPLPAWRFAPATRIRSSGSGSLSPSSTVLTLTSKRAASSMRSLGSVGGIQEDELQHASGVAVLALLDDGAMAEDAVRAFITDYVFEVSITEVGDELRDGTRDGYTTVDQEDQLRDLIETSVNQLDLPARLDADNIQEAIYNALDDARTFLRATE